MKYENTGLFTFCLQLGMHLKQQLIPCEELTYYTPSHISGIFGSNHSYITQHSFQKLWLPSTKNFDIWHCTYQSSRYLPILNRKIKVVLTIHDLNFLYDTTKTITKKNKYLRHIQSNIDRSDIIVCISEFCKRDVMTHCQVNKPIFVIHNGTNTLELPILTNRSYKPRNKFLFSIGVVNRKKNYHVLLPLLQQNQDMELLIAGRPDDPDYVHYIKSTARKLGVEDKVNLLGPITEKEKSWYYEHCYAFTFPSISEGFGLPVTEAMSVGKPLFLSNKTSLPEIAKDVAFYFSDFSEQQMQKTFINGMKTYELKNMKEKIKKRSTEFCWQKAAAQYVDLYRSLY